MRGKRKLILLPLLLTMLVCLAGYFLLAVYYQKSFGLNTWINGVYCTGKTVEEVNSELLLNAEAPIIAITDKAGLTYYLDLAQADCEIDYEAALNRYLKGQNPFLWLENIISDRSHRIGPDITVEDDALKRLWEGIPFVKEERQAPKTLEIRLGEEGFFLYNGLENRLDLDKAYTEMLSAARRGETQLSLTKQDCYYSLAPSGEQEALLRLWEKIEEFQSCRIVFDMGDRQIPIAGSITAAFLETENGIPVLSAEGELVISKEAVEGFIKELAAEYDTYGVERTFQSTRGESVVIKGGTYGTRLNQKAEVNYLLEKLENPGKLEIHVPSYEKEALYRGKNDIGPTYIEIDMTNQKMYYYEEGTLLVETDVVTGNMSRRWGTPEGVNYVYNKQKNRILRGPGYASPVKFWMPVNGGIGIHDADWRSEFGGEIYQRNGSHGCINTPAEVMTELYDMVEVGTPVVMFY